MTIDSLLKMSQSLGFYLDHMLFLSRLVAVFFPMSDLEGRAILHMPAIACADVLDGRSDRF
jgi:hypothetical protein